MTPAVVAHQAQPVPYYHISQRKSASVSHGQIYFSPSTDNYMQGSQSMDDSSVGSLPCQTPVGSPLSSSPSKTSGLLKSLKKFSSLFGKSKHAKAAATMGGINGVHYNPNLSGFSKDKQPSSNGSDDSLSCGHRLPPAKLAASVSTSKLSAAKLMLNTSSLSRFHDGSGSPLGAVYTPMSPMPLRREPSGSDSPAEREGHDMFCCVTSPCSKAAAGSRLKHSGTSSLSAASPHDSAASMSHSPAHIHYPGGSAHHHSSAADASLQHGQAYTKAYSAGLNLVSSKSASSVSIPAGHARPPHTPPSPLGGSPPLPQASHSYLHAGSIPLNLNLMLRGDSADLEHQMNGGDVRLPKIAPGAAAAAASAKPVSSAAAAAAMAVHANANTVSMSAGQIPDYVSMAALTAAMHASGKPTSPVTSGPGTALSSRASTPPSESDDVLGPTSRLLAVSPALPGPMRRRRWQLDDYKIIKRLYKGQTSAVYKAVCNRTGLNVALKVYFLSKVPSNVIHMIQREIEIHSQLVHKNIIMLYGAFQDDKHIVLVQEYAARGDLFGIHRQLGGRMPEVQVTEQVLGPFLDALGYLHQRNVCHRDIKPENVLFTEDWTLKLADFGVSINLHEERAVTRTGTFDYMAPEVERCPLKCRPEDNKDDLSLAYNTAVDVWSVGVLAYELLVGFPPFVTPKPQQGGNAAKEQAGVEAGGVAGFMAQEATRRTLRFPASTSQMAKEFINAALAEFAGDRPTAHQLLRHPWLFRATQRRRASGTSNVRYLGHPHLGTTPELPDGHQ